MAYGRVAARLKLGTALAMYPGMDGQRPSKAMHQWLRAVRADLEVRRRELAGVPRPPRNRAREKARREARQLFRAYYEDCVAQECG